MEKENDMVNSCKNSCIVVAVVSAIMILLFSVVAITIIVSLSNKDALSKAKIIACSFTFLFLIIFAVIFLLSVKNIFKSECFASKIVFLNELSKEIRDKNLFKKYCDTLVEL